MSAQERFYDEHIAPALAALAQRCMDNGLSLVATVQFGPSNDDRGTTLVMQPDANLAMVMARYCVMTAPNVDAYMIGLTRYCKENGIDTSASMYMNHLSGSAA
jgi:hypothetical protein